LAAIGYDSSSMAMVPYDWRLDYEMLEDRDGTFTKLKKTIEGYVTTNDGQKAVIMGHSMGGQFVFSFLVWVDEQEEGWCEKYIHTYMDLAGPLLGLPKAASALLSGEMKEANSMSPFAGLIENVFGRKKRHELFSSWGSLWSMAPLGGDEIWGVGADIDCGEGRVQSGVTCADETTEDGIAPKRYVPFLTFIDDKPDLTDGDNSMYAKYASKENWTFSDVLAYLREWKEGHRGPEFLKNSWNDVTKKPLPNAPSMKLYVWSRSTNR
jgi:phospholipid:diacylglycerol acyltransferase